MLRVSGWFWEELADAEGLRMVLRAAGSISRCFWEQLVGAEGRRVVLGAAGRC